MAEEVLKSTWKKTVKEKITQHEEREIRERCMNSTKSRFTREDTYEKKEYLRGKVDTKMAKQIIRVRMNMSYLPSNYKQTNGGRCPLCDQEEGKLEHYLKCPKVRSIRKVWNVVEDDLRSMEIMKMKNVARFVEKIELMLEPSRV
jgi:hypothetical protein